MSPLHSLLEVPVRREHGESAGSRSERFRRGVALVATVITVATLVTGAVAQAAAPVRLVSFETHAEDGTVLRGDVYLPEADGPVGTVLQLSPYWNTIKGPGELQAENQAVRPFVEAGFAVASSVELLPDPLKPRITITTDEQLPGALALPLVAGQLRFS